MDKILVKKLLREAKISQTDIARSVGVSVVAIHRVVKGEKKTPRLQLAIAQAMGRDVLDVFPEYQPRRTRKQNRPAPDGGNNAAAGDDRQGDQPCLIQPCI